MGSRDDGNPPTPPSWGPSARVGAVLGPYRLTDVLGRGAMATVFRAHDQRLGRQVAVKVMNLGIAARPDAAERFRREAQAVAALKHPGIVEIHDFSAGSADEPAYIVVELVEGPTLSALLAERGGRILPEVAALVGAAIAEALAVAHRRGVVHRDVKPDNVMIERAAENSRVVLTDFGVAQVTGLEAMTLTGALMGSPAYMAPEQTRGQDVGPASDIWSLGVILYQMATGSLPFSGREPLTVLSAIARGTFRKPTQVAATVGPDYERVVLRCLRQAPAERYPEAATLAADLRTIAREVGLDDGPTALRRFLDDPSVFEGELRPRVAERAVENARRHARRAEIGHALAEISRATAYVSRHAGAEALLASLSARRRWARGAATLALAAAVLVGARILWPASPSLRENRTARPARAPALASPGAEPTGSSRELATPTPARAPENPAELRPRRERRPTLRPERPAPPPSEPAAIDPAPVATSPEPAGASSEPSPPAAAGAAQAPPPPPGSVRLFSNLSFCDPSLDDRPGGFSPVEYPEVPPGSHEVYCQIPGRPKSLVRRIVVAPNAALEMTILKGPDGLPRPGNLSSAPRR